MASLQDHISSVKRKKKDMLTFLAESCYFEHPNPLSVISLSGSLSVVVDERDFSSPDTTANVFTYNIDFSALPGRARLATGKNPFIGLPVALSEGEFALSGSAAEPWRFLLSDLAPASATTVGGIERKAYSRPTTDDPWELGGETTYDLDAWAEFSVSGGGLPPSYGKGLSTGAEKVDTRVGFFYTSDGYTGYLPILDGHAYRLPWDFAWASETAEFSTLFSDYLSDSNDLYGGGFSGSCSLSLDFAF